MGNKRSRAARLSGGGAGAIARWRHTRDLQRQVNAARVMMAAQGRRPPSPAKLRALGVLMFVVCALIGAGAAIVAVVCVR